MHILKGNNQWSPNNFSIITLSDIDFGDLNFDHIINIVDIIFMVEHIIDTHDLNNNHQLLLADINQDQIINIAYTFLFYFLFSNVFDFFENHFVGKVNAG